MQVPCLFGMELAFAYGLFSGGGRIARRERIEARKRLFRREAALKIAGFSRCVSKKEALCEKAGESKARQRCSKSMEGKTALLSTHISFFVLSPMARPCYLLPLWTCTPPGFREEAKRAPESGFPDWIQGGARSEKQCGPLGHARNGDRLWRIRLYSL